MKIEITLPVFLLIAFASGIATLVYWITSRWKWAPWAVIWLTLFVLLFIITAFRIL